MCVYSAPEKLNGKLLVFQAISYVVETRVSVSIEGSSWDGDCFERLMSLHSHRDFQEEGFVPLLWVRDDLLHDG